MNKILKPLHLAKYQIPNTKYLQRGFIKITKHLLINYLIVATVFFGSGLFYLFNPFGTKQTDAAWFNDAWGFRKALTIDDAQVSGSSNLSNFPVLVSLTDSNVDDFTQDDGDDLVFTDIGGNRLDHEIERYAESGGSATIVAWVRIPSLSPTTDTTIYMYYGNPSASNQEKAKAVWDSNYVAVFHMEEEDTSTDMPDSTGINTGTQTAAAGPAFGAGQVGYHQDFDGSDDMVKGTTTGMSATTGSVEGWFNLDTGGGSDALFKHPNISDHRIAIVVNASNQLLTQFGSDGTGVLTGDTLTVDTYYHVMITWNSGTYFVYLNGVQTDTGSYTGLSTIHSCYGFGANPSSCTGTADAFDGRIDEGRVSNTARSVDWALTSYNNQNAPGTFMSTGSEEKAPSPTLYWKFDEGQGTTANDSSSNNLDGSIASAVSGDGADGAVTFSSDTNLNTGAARSCSDGTHTYGASQGWAPIFTSTSNTSASSTTMTIVQSQPDSTCLAAGDEVLIVNQQNTSITNVGTYEFADVSSVSGTTLTFTAGLTNAYDGTSGTQKIVIYRVPNFTTVQTSTASTDLTPLAWDGTAGGVLAFRASTSVTVDASTTINSNSAGYRGGAGGDNTDPTAIDGTDGGVMPFGGIGGESFDGSGASVAGQGSDGATDNQSKGGGKSGDNSTTSPNNGTARGGGGGGGSDGQINNNGGAGSGGGGGYGGGGGGGGGGHSNGTGGNGGSGDSTGGTAGGGGGGACGATPTSAANGGNAGSAGDNANCVGNGQGGEVGSGTTAASGGGGGNFSSGGGAGGGGGGLYGTAALSTIFLGSGGGGGGESGNSTGTDVAGVAGSSGGGIIIIGANTLTVSGAIQSNGGAATTTPTADGGRGGAGSGGSILFMVSNASLGSSLVTASGGASSSGGTAVTGAGGGGVGRIAVEYAGSTSGTTSPTATTTQAGSSPDWKTEDFCVAGKCLYFDGVNDDNVKRDDDAKLDFVAADNFTVSGWIKHSGAIATNNDYILAKSSAAGATFQGYKLYMDDTGDLCFRVGDGTDMASACTSGVDFDDDKWHFVSGVKAGTTSITLYVDGVSRATTTPTSVDSLANSGSLFVGIDSDSAANEWLGFIDDIKVFRDNTARTAAQIAADYNARSNPDGAALQAGPPQGNNPAALSSGLVGYWKMDETSSTAADSSGIGLTLTNNATTTYTFGKFGNAGTFVAASSQYLNTTTDINGVKTVSFWTNPSANSDEYVSLITSTAYITSSSGTVSATGFTSPTIYVNGVINGTITASTWNHVVVTSETGVNATDWEIGRANGAYHNGKIDDARVYNRALSNSEVSQLYNWAPGPIGNWDIEEKGQTVYDTSGNGNNGFLGVDATVEAADDPLWVQGKYGAGLDFVSADKVTFGTVTTFDVPTITVEAWVWSDVAGNGQAATIDDGSNPGRRWNLGVGTSGNFRFAVFVGTPTPTQYNAESTTNFSINAWHHLTGTYDGETVRLYVDGVLTAEDTTPSGNLDTEPADLRFGMRQSGTSDWDGKVDSVRIYSYPRTQGQIIEDMNAGHPAPGSPVGSPTGYWKFDEGADNKCSGGTNDVCNSGSVGNVIDGTLTATSRTLSGKFGSAFDGGDQRRAAIADNANLDFIAGEDLSISFWFKSDSDSNPSANEYLVEKGGNIATDAVGYAIYTSAASDGLICFGIDDDATTFPEDETCSSSDIYDAHWHHIVAKKTGSSRLDLYVDGKPNGTADTSISATATLANAAVFYIGDTNATDGTDEFLGNMDDVKVFRSALTEDQVKLDMNRGSSQVMGALSSNSSNGDQATAASQEYCIPGGTDASCAGPVGRWDLEEGTGTTAYDTSTNGNDLTLTNSPTYTIGKFGKGINFQTLDSQLTRADDADFDFVSSFTLEAWFKHGTDGSSNRMITKYSSGAGQGGYTIRLTTVGFVLCGIDDDETSFPEDTAQSAAEYDDDEWHHVACVKDGNTGLYVYVDGVLDGTDTSISSTGDLSNDAPLYIGVEQDGAGSDFAIGQMDNIRIFNYARSQAQVAWDYNRGAPVGHWKMDECQGTTLNDSAGNSLTGTLTGATAGTCSTSGAWFNGVTGKRNYSLDFDGTDDVVTVTNAAAIDFDTGLSKGVTFAGWIYANTDGEGDVGRIFEKGASTYCRTDSESGGLDLECQLDLLSGTDPNVNIADAFQVNTWNHVVMAYNDDADDEIEVYINGVLRGTSTTGVDVPQTTDTNNLTIGNNPGTTTSFDGQIDDFRVYNYGLTATQVKTLMDDGALRFGPATGAP